MKILIDGHSLSTQQKTGKHHHTIALLRQIVKHKKSKDHQFHLLINNVKNFPIKNKNLKILKARRGLKFYLDFLSIQKKYDLIISPTSYIPPLLTKNKSLTFIYDLASFKNKQFKPDLKAQIIEKLLIRKVLNKSYVVTMTKTVKHQLIDLFPKIKYPIQVIPGFSRFSGKKNPRLTPPKRPYILFVGTFEPRKNIPNTLKAYKILLNQLKKSKQKPPKFVIVGKKGWRQKNLQKIIKNLKLTPHIDIKGYVSNKKLSHLYQKALFVCYIPFYEGFGLPIIEAINYQKPVLTSNQSTLKEVIGPCGITVNPTNIEKISLSMYKLTTDKHLRNTYKKQTRKHKKKYLPKKSASKFFQILKFII